MDFNSEFATTSHYVNAAASIIVLNEHHHQHQQQQQQQHQQQLQQLQQLQQQPHLLISSVGVGGDGGGGAGIGIGGVQQRQVVKKYNDVDTSPQTLAPILPQLSHFKPELNSSEAHTHTHTERIRTFQLTLHS